MNFEMENILYISAVTYSFQSNPFPNIGKNRSVTWKHFKQGEKLDYYSDLKNVTGVGKSKFAKNADLAILISDINNLDIDTLEKVASDFSSIESKIDKRYVDKWAIVPVSLENLSDVVDNRFVKCTVYDERTC